MCLRPDRFGKIMTFLVIMKIFEMSASRALQLQ